MKPMLKWKSMCWNWTYDYIDIAVHMQMMENSKLFSKNVVSTNC